MIWAPRLAALPLLQVAAQQRPQPSGQWASKNFGSVATDTFYTNNLARVMPRCHAGHTFNACRTCRERNACASLWAGWSISRLMICEATLDLRQLEGYLVAGVLQRSHEWHHEF